MLARLLSRPARLCSDFAATHFAQRHFQFTYVDAFPCLGSSAASGTRMARIRRHAREAARLHRLQRHPLLVYPGSVPCRVSLGSVNGLSVRTLDPLVPGGRSTRLYLRRPITQHTSQRQDVGCSRDATTSSHPFPRHPRATDRRYRTLAGAPTRVPPSRTTRACQATHCPHSEI